MKKVKVSGRSSLVVGGDCILEDLELDGHLELREEGSVKAHHLGKDYKSVAALSEGEAAYLQIRGYKLA